MTEASTVDISDEQKIALKALLDQGQEINAVRLCRSYLDCDLVEAKAVVDTLKSVGEVDIAQNSEMGLMSPLGILVLLLILGGYWYIR